MIQVRVPGNILLLGEYAVLERDGLGIAMAVPPFVTAAVAAADGFSVEGTTGTDQISWSTAGGGDLFLERAVTALDSALVQHGNRSVSDKPLAVTINSSQFFSSNGRKQGFGSSAAVVVALVLGTLRALQTIPPASGDAGPVVTADDTMQIAIDVHRAAQSGRGSGYDVAASINGGIGLFSGGPRPKWWPIRPSRFPVIHLNPGPASVDTRGAIEKLERFRVESPADFALFVRNSNAAAHSFIEAVGRSDWADTRNALHDARRVASGLGDTIGVPSQPSGGADKLASQTGAVAKCLGAGDELTAIFSDWATSKDPTPSAPGVPAVVVYPEFA